MKHFRQGYCIIPVRIFQCVIFMLIYRKDDTMAKKKKGELPSGNVRRNVFIGYEYLVDENGQPILDENGKQKKKRKYKSITASSTKDVERIKASIKANNVKYNSKSEMTLREAITKYINDSEATHSPSTIRGYEGILKNGFQHIMDVRLCDFDNDFMKVAINTEKKRPHQRIKGKCISSKTVTNEYGLIASVIKMYAPEIELNPMLPQVPVNQNDISTADVLFPLFKDTEIELPVLLAMWMSFTLSEILGFTKSKSISRDGNSITVKEVKVMDKNYNLVVKETGKQPSRERTLEIPEYIKGLIDKVETDQLVTLSGAAIRSRFKRTIERAGLPHMTFHDLRHVNASVMSKVGVPIMQAQARGGWKSDSVMKTRYTQAFSAERASADSLVDNYFDHIIASIGNNDKKREEKYRAWRILFDKKDCIASQNEFDLFIQEHNISV